MYPIARNWISHHDRFRKLLGFRGQPHNTERCFDEKTFPNRD